EGGDVSPDRQAYEGDDVPSLVSLRVQLLLEGAGFGHLGEGFSRRGPRSDDERFHLIQIVQEVTVIDRHFQAKTLERFVHRRGSDLAHLVDEDRRAYTVTLEWERHGSRNSAAGGRLVGPAATGI